MIKPIDIYRFIRRYNNDYKASKSQRVKVFNSLLPDNWLTKFITERGILDLNSKMNISIFSVNGDRLAIDLNRSDYKIFCTGENVHVPYSSWAKYEDLLLNKKSIDLSMGFDYIDHEKYIRFPLWLMYFFKPEDDFHAIKLKCELLNHPRLSIGERKKFCAFICRNDYFGDRINIYNKVNTIAPVNCSSEFMHNDDDLRIKYNDNKLDYLKQFKFNLCPENSNNDGYVTEKIFEAISSGCIPIYWGSNNNPEPNIINKDAVFFIENNYENSNAISDIELLNNNNKLYKDFAEQDRLLPNAAEVIFDFFENLEKKLIDIVR